MKQAYGSEPILFSSSPISRPPQASKPATTYRRIRRIVGYILAGIIVIGICGFVLVRQNSQTAYSFSKAMITAARFTLYEPVALPEGYVVDRQSITSTADVVTFTINTAQGKAAVVTEQPRPPQANLEAFYKDQLSDRKTYTTKVGQVTAGQFEGSQLAGIETKDSWIIVRSVTQIDASTFQRITHSFEAARR